MKEEKLIEAGCEDVQLTLKSKVDLYVGQVIEAPDPRGTKVLCVVTSIDKVYLKDFKITIDCKVEPLHITKRKE